MTKEKTDIIITEQNRSRDEILKAVAKFKADYRELCNLKDMRIAELEKQNKELKEFYEEEVRDLLKENYALITKTKEIIKKLKALYFIPVVTNDDVKRQDEILNEAEQFLNSEVEK